jgi:hypothetical protein
LTTGTISANTDLVDYKLGIIGGLSVLLAGLIVNAPPVRSRLKTPIMRAIGAGLLAAVMAVGGLLIERLVFHTP